MDASEYKKYVEKKSPPSPLILNMVKAFVVGGAICTFGQFLQQLYENTGLNTEDASCLVSVTLIFISVILTGFGLYSKIAKHAGAGTLVPITGFANAVSSSAIESKSEGYITGVGAKLFTIAGPVIVYGITAAAAAGTIYYLFSL